MSAITLKTGTSNGDAVINWMPCNIDHNGEAEVDRYFNACNKNVGQDCMEGSFRGRCIMGKTIDVPSRYKGVVVKEKNLVCSDHQERKVEVVNDFEKLTYWNLETKPSQNDALMNAFDWLSAATILHSPITTNDEVEENIIKSSPPERREQEE